MTSIKRKQPSYTSGTGRCGSAAPLRGVDWHNIVKQFQEVWAQHRKDAKHQRATQY
jgi:hypothetical protein